MGWYRLWMCLALVGCIEAQLKPCGDLLCPVDSVCLPNNTCASQESIDVCVGKADGETCSTTLFTGSCANGVCTAPVCGDEIVSGSEQCDGAAPEGTDCVSYGFDTGVPTCSDRCGLDVVGSCVRFGWDRVLSQPASRVAIDSGRIALITEDGLTLQLYNGTQLLQERTLVDNDYPWFDFVALRGPIALGGGQNHLVRSDNGGPFVDVDASMALDGIIQVAIGDDGSIYAGTVDAGGIHIVRQLPGSTTWTPILQTGTNGNWFRWIEGALYVSYENGRVDRWVPGGAWTTVLTALSDVEWLAPRAAGGYYVETEVNGAFEIVSATEHIPFGSSNYDQIIPLGDAVYAGGDDIVVDRRVGDQYERSNAPVIGSLATDGTDLYIYGNGIYKFSGTQWGRRPGSGAPARDIELLGDGQLAMASSAEILVTDGPDSWDQHYANDAPIAIAGPSIIDFYVAEAEDIEHYAHPGFVSTNPPGSIAPLDLVWQSATSTLFVVGKAGASLKRTGTAWTPLTGIPTSCDASGMAQNGNDIYAVGTCGADGAIWKLSGTTWSEVHRVSTPLVAMWVDASDNLYATGKTTSITRVSGIWNDLAGPAGGSISATGPSDIWVGGGANELAHWNGMLWSRVRIVGAAGPKVLATPRAVYVCGASDAVILR